METTVELVRTRPPLEFAPLPSEVEPVVGRGEVALRVIAMAEAIAAYVPTERRDEAYRDGVRALHDRVSALRHAPVSKA